MADREYCDSCRWWGAERAHDHSYPYGTCRKQPAPRGKVMTLPYHDPDRPSEPGPIIERAEWRWTAFDDWCGAHFPKTESLSD